MQEKNEDASRRSGQDESNIKETIVSLVISFVMALVFRSYVVEAFVIPTGSMAPTLLGAHMRFHSEQSGHNWAVNPAYYTMRGNERLPLSIQGGDTLPPPIVTDPMSTSRANEWTISQPPSTPIAGFIPRPEPKRLRAGDRILVQKYLYELFPPKRFDVVVFKNPEQARENYIKRLLGLPNEQVWLADGDVFARPIRMLRDGEAEITGEWRIQRKPTRIQRTLWRRIYSSEFAPIDPVRDGRRWFVDPWVGRGWSIDGARVYTFGGAGETVLSWDTESWPIWDWEPYNDFPEGYLRPRFPVKDLRMRAGVRAEREGLSVVARLRANQHELEAVIGEGRAELRMRPSPGDGAQAESAPWSVLGTASVRGFPAGEVVNVEFWHFDQSLQLWIGGKRVLEAAYEWRPRERMLHATGHDVESDEVAGIGNLLSQPEIYEPGRPSVSWRFEGSPLTLHRVGLDRDVYYQSTTLYGSQPALGTHPRSLASLGPDRFFFCGDNSPNSKDGRLWDVIDEEVARQLFGYDPDEMSSSAERAARARHMGIVPRELILGKAFYVYFPAPHTFGGRVPVPDFGRMRSIR